MLKNQRLTVALALALGSSHALALGLGTIDVRTKLNEPLVAEIPIISSSPAELADLQVRLASPDAFVRVGLDRPSALSANLEFAIIKGKDGRSVVRVTTPSKVRDPFISFLLEVEWGRGRLLREYTVLLDPPVMVPVRSAPAPSVPVASTAPVPATPPVQEIPLGEPPPVAIAPAPAPTPTPAPAPAPRATAPAPTPPAPAPTPAAPRQDNYGPVRSGETLWSIAEFLRPNTDVSMDQMMIALLSTNPDAFIDGNINRLKKGAVMRIPTAEQINAVSRQAATAQVIEQTREWRSQAGQALQPEAPAADRRTTAAPAPAADSRLELVPPKGDQPASAAQSGASAAGAGAEVRADLTRAREQVTVLQQENRELQSRVQDLEKIDADSKRLIELKNSELAAAQARVADLERAVAQAGGEATELAATTTPANEEAVVAAEPKPEDALIDVSDVLDEMEGVSPAEGEPEGSSSEPLAAAPDVAEPTPVAPTQTSPADEAEGEAWYSNPMILGGAGGLVLLGGLWAVFARRQKPAPARSTRASVADNYAAAAAGASAAAAAAAEADEAQEDPAQPLVDAIAEQPDDLGRHLRLVRHYYEAGDESGFEGAAEAMYAQLFDPEDMSWKQVLAMGRELLPDHPLFAAPVSTEEDDRAEFSSSPSAADLDEDANADAEQAEQLASFDYEAPRADPEPESDLEPDFESASDSAEEPERQQVNWDEDTDASTQSFNIEDVQRLAESQRKGMDAAPASDESEDVLDEPSEPQKSGSESSGSMDLPEVDLTEGNLDGDDASATKLELARAYLDMGDVEGARGMLEEVVNEGNAGQRSEAKRLLDEIR